MINRNNSICAGKRLQKAGEPKIDNKSIDGLLLSIRRYAKLFSGIN